MNNDLLTDPALQFRFRAVCSYAAGREGAGLSGGPVAAVKVEAGVKVEVGGVGDGWKLEGFGEDEERRGSFGPAGDRTDPELDSALTFCRKQQQHRMLM